METNMRELLKFLFALGMVALAIVSQASAQLSMTGAGNSGPSAGGGITFTPTDKLAVAAAFNPGTTGALAIGTASTDRIVAVCWSKDSGGGTADPTYNGSSVFSIAAGNGLASDKVVLYYANITTGTTMTISYPGGAADFSMGIGIFKGQSGGGAATMGNPQVVTTNDPQPLNSTTPITFTVPSGGIGIACGGGPVGGGGAATFTWTGTANSSGDENAVSTNSQISMSHMTSSAAATVSSTSSMSFNGSTMAYGSMAP
jgi:hypothetical protein